MRKLTTILMLLVGLLGLGTPVLAEDTRLTIVHTNDLHSHFLGFSPNADYTPLSPNDDATLGGWARIATVIRDTKANRQNPVLVLDGGDFLMGSLFHTISREEALELALLKEMGVEFSTLGNHEFDFGPDGLARILSSAEKNGHMLQIVASNLVFDPQDSKDDQLQAQLGSGLVKPYVVLDRDGMKIGIFGLMGKDADFAAPFASPVTFEDPVENAKKLVAVLRGKEEVDVVICLSHGGLNDNPGKSEDLILAREVDGIDVIVSSHTDTLLDQPITENGTIIVHAHVYGKRVGVLDLIAPGDGIRLAGYDYVTIDDSIPGDARIDGLVRDAVAKVDQQFLAPHGLKFEQVVVETGFALKRKKHESTIGNLVSDSLRWAADRAEYDPANPASRVAVAMHSNGGIREGITTGKTGQITVADLFRILPLGFGPDGSAGYPMVSVYVTGAEIKKLYEVLTTFPDLKGDDYNIQSSGARVAFNPNRMLFDRVTGIWLDDGTGTYKPLDTSAENRDTYKVVASLYHATFLKVIGSFTMGILEIVPKDAEGQPIEDLGAALIDADPDTPGVQELKEWAALIDYVQQFEDITGNGIPDIPDRYAALQGRQLVDDSLNPIKLVAGGNYVTWVTVALIALTLMLIVLLIYLPVRFIRKRRARV